MATQYMDYGIIPSAGGNNTLPSVPVNNTRYTQVYYHTHEGEDKSLSFTNKAFISFTYDGRKIEDFGLIAVTVNDRLNRETPPEHEDYTTEYKMLHGQYYWGSHYTARELDIALATDGMTQDQLDDFKYWFRAGSIRELVLSLHPNRAIKARVREAPKISVLPFKREKTITIDKVTRIINVIEYKGEIELNFVMDEPFWYAKEDILGHRKIDEDGGIVIVDKWKDVNGKEVNILDTEDALRIVEEDHIPTASMIYTETNLANGLLLKKYYNERKYTIGTYESEGAPIVNNETGLGIENDKNFLLNGAVVGPLLLTAYSDGLKINIEPLSCLTEYILNNNGMLASPQYTDLDLSERTQNNTTKNYYPVKARSSIAFKKLKDSDVLSLVTVTIITYNKNKNNDIYLLKEVKTLSTSSDIYKALEDEFIRLTIRIKNKFFTEDQISLTIADTDDVININKNEPMTFFNLLDLNLIAFNTKTGMTLSKLLINGLQYFYAGTAPSYPTISFDVPIVFDQKGYIISFNNEYSNADQPYNSLILKSNELHQLKITMPSIFNSYNKVIDILRSNTSIIVIKLINTLREEIGHSGVRNWIIGCINLYYNNHSQTINTAKSLNVTDEVKQQLLQYMPYFFATFDESGITKQKKDPALQLITSSNLKDAQTEINEKLYPLPTFKRIDSLSARFQIQPDRNLLEIDTSIDNSNKTLLQLVPIFQITTNEGADQGILYWRWQYSNDGQKWFLLFNTEKVWSGVDTPILTCYSVAGLGITPEHPLYLRCIISNNSSYAGTEEKSILQVLPIDNDLTIECKDFSSLPINYGELAIITWTINGQFITSDATGNDAQYKPNIYYYPLKNNEEELWHLLSNEDNFDGQIENYNFNISNNVATLTFKVNENKERTLRGTKFELRLYRRTATNINNYESALSSLLLINRLEQLGAITIRSSPAPVKQTTDEPIILSYERDTQLTVLVQGIKNFDLSESYWGYRKDPNKNYSKLTVGKSKFKLKYSINNGNPQLKGNFRTGEANSDNGTWEFHFFGIAYDEKLESDSIFLRQITTSEINDTIVDSILPIKTKTGRDEISYSANNKLVDSISIYIGSEQTISASYPSNDSLAPLPDNSLVKCTYQWERGVLNSNTQEILWTTIENATNKEYTIEASGDDNQTYYYRCKIPYARIEHKDDSTICSTDVLTNYSLDNWVQCNMYLKPGTISVQGGLSLATYYTDLDELDTKSLTGIEVSDDQPYTINLTCNVLNARGINLSTIKWYKLPINNENNVKPIGTDYNELSVPISMTPANFSNTAWNNIKYYCTFKDNMGQDYTSDFLLIQYTVKSSRVQPINILESWVQTPDITWLWPYVLISFNMGQQSNTNKSVSLATNITDTIQNNSVSWECLGVFPPLPTPIPINQNTDPYTNYRNLDIIPKETNSSKLTSIPTDSKNMVWKYDSINLNNFGSSVTIYSMPSLAWQNMDSIQFLINVTTTNDSKYKYELSVTHGTSTISPTDNVYNIPRNSTSSNDNDNDININVKLYSNIQWPIDIGYMKVINASMTGGNPYTETLWSKHTGTITISLTNLQGAPSSNSVNSANQESQPRMLMNTRSLKAAISIPKAATSELVHQIRLNHLCHFTINCKTGEYFMPINYNYIMYPNGLLTNGIESTSFDASPNNICYFSNLRKNEPMIETIESVGDMILSNNLVFELQNHFGSDNTIQPWSEDDKTLSHQLTYDGDIPLLNFKLEYKNYYL